MVGLSHFEDGQSVTLDAGSFKNPLSLVIFSMLFPIISGLPKTPYGKINGKKYYDGWMTNPLMLGEDQSTDVLYVLPCPLSDRLPNLGPLERTLGRVGAFTGIFNRQMELLQSVLEGKATFPGSPRVAAIYPEKKISPLSLDGREIWQGMEESRSFAQSIFRAAA